MPAPSSPPRALPSGARIAQEKLGLPTATVHLQPTVIRSLVDHGMFGKMRISSSQPMWFKRALFRFIDWAAIDRLLQRPLNDFRSIAGPAARRAGARSGWLHSPQCVIGFFPDWFAPPQPDWPPNVHLVGFPLWDGASDAPSARAPLPDAAQEFLDAGEPPVIVTPGSAAATMQRLFHRVDRRRPRPRPSRHADHEFPRSVAAPRCRRGSKDSAICPSAKCCRARRSSCITAESARSHRRSRAAFPTWWCRAPTISSTTAGASPS